MKIEEQTRKSQICGRMSSMRPHVSELIANSRLSIYSLMPNRHPKIEKNRNFRIVSIDTAFAPARRCVYYK